jgi:hypothetical protein
MKGTYVALSIGLTLKKNSWDSKKQTKNSTHKNEEKMKYVSEDFVHHVAVHTGVHFASVKRFVLLDIVRHDQCRPAIIVSREKPRF